MDILGGHYLAHHSRNSISTLTVHFLSIWDVALCNRCLEYILHSGGWHLIHWALPRSFGLVSKGFSTTPPDQHFLGCDRTGESRGHVSTETLPCAPVHFLWPCLSSIPEATLPSYDGLTWRVWQNSACEGERWLQSYLMSPEMLSFYQHPLAHKSHLWMMKWCVSLSMCIYLLWLEVNFFNDCES